MLHLRVSGYWCFRAHDVNDRVSSVCSRACVRVRHEQACVQLEEGETDEWKSSAEIVCYARMERVCQKSLLCRDRIYKTNERDRAPKSEGEEGGRDGEVSMGIDML